MCKLQNRTEQNRTGGSKCSVFREGKTEKDGGRGRSDDFCKRATKTQKEKNTETQKTAQRERKGNDCVCVCAERAPYSLMWLPSQSSPSRVQVRQGNFTLCVTLYEWGKKGLKP